MRPDQKISDDSFSVSASFSIRMPFFSGFYRGFLVHGGISDAHLLKNSHQLWNYHRIPWN